MRILVIGDIHGCFSELQDLLAGSGIGDTDAVIALGDFVDRGPETPEVLDFIMYGSGVQSLMGNHERKHMRTARGEVKLAIAQRITQIQAGEAYPDLVDFCSTLPTWIELPEAILVHGYVEPGVAMDEQLATVLCGTMGGERHMKQNYNQPWYELYDREKPVIVGHHDYHRNGEAFVFNDQVFGLDTSCVHGKTLTGLVLPDFKIVSVPSRQNHWYGMRKQYRQQFPIRKGIPKTRIVEIVEWDEDSLRLLEEVLDRVHAENERCLARLRQQPGYESLTAREQARTYAAELSTINLNTPPIATLMHLSRIGKLTTEKARIVVKNPELTFRAAQHMGIR